MFARTAYIAVVATALLALPAPGAGQPAHQVQATGKKVLDHDVYDGWRTIRDRALTADGQWLAFRYVPGEGDAELILRRTDGDESHAIPRASSVTLSEDGRYAIVRIAPGHAEVKALRRDGKKGDDLPPDTLGILMVGSDVTSMVRIPRVESFKLPEEGSGFVAFIQSLSKEEKEAMEAAEEAGPEAEPEAAEEPEEATEADEEEKEKPERGDGEPLVLHSLSSGQEWRFPDVTAYVFAPDGAFLIFTRATEDGEGDGVFVVDTSTGEASALASGIGRYEGLVASETGYRVAYLSDYEDWEVEEPAFSLYVATHGDEPPARVAGPGSDGLPGGWGVSEHGTLRFSDDGERLFFGSAPRPSPEPEDDLLDDEKVTVDIWNWRDPFLQPMQVLQADDERNRNYQAVVHLDRDNRIVQLGTEAVPEVRIPEDGSGPVAMGVSDIPYRQLLSWDGRYFDSYLIDMESGQATRVAEKVRGFNAGSLSPAGRYVGYWNEFEKAWMAVSTETGQTTNLSSNIPFPTWDELDDHPQPPPPESFIRWTEGDEEAVVADAFDLWLVDPETGQARSLTEGVGREQGLRFRYAQTDPEETAIPRDRPIHLTAFDVRTKASGIYRDEVDSSGEPVRLVFGDMAFGGVTRAEDADVFVLTTSTFQRFPDLLVTDGSFSELRKVSDANPQQAEYSWGTAEIVEWASTDGDPLQGILYKPEGFDPDREYPMMVYFYERMSDGLHRHIVPAPGSSSVNFSFYVSRGYLLFIPDIPYKIGWPGESAMNAVMPGVLEIMAEGFVDPARIGVQGHSWGGYQISYMVTKTNLFAAAEAGAPVSNMTSAYGGIRWGSGMSRMFQYERTQSRIGGTLWDAQHRYISNSPLFQADKVETPLLMMHNDEDTAVPWEQGIEYFVALRRLGKPVWMLNYNGEPHGLRRRANQKDWTVRMQQFFDHFLLDAPPPVWLVEGVPAVDKGRTLGLDLITETQPITEEAQGNGSGG
jgi:dipeptidyl aminopeptidase/acylaminoacyl peptidase